MCGITGIWNLDSAPISPGALARFRDTLAHRGPDGAGLYVDERAGLGLAHRRLAILDLSDRGRQPMGYLQGRYQITFNGEIFNFLEIQAQLKTLGHCFTSGTDTEVILAAFAEWGEACQTRFNGMWAFAIWDSAERRLFLSRDRFGVKPLYYTNPGRQFAFASEMKSFLALEGFTAEPDWETMSVALANSFDVERRPNCLLKGVKRLLAGHCAWVETSGIRVKRWWNTFEHLPPVPATFEEQTAHFLDLFKDACRLRMRSDVPVVSCLSGGLDSSSIVCTIAQNLEKWRADGAGRAVREPQRVFVAEFPGAPNDERDFAQAVIDHANAQSTFCAIDNSLSLEATRSILWDCEEIFFNFPLAIWSTYQSLRKSGHYVTLDGHGADELLAGYPQHILAAVSGTKGLLHPRRLREMLELLEAVYGRDSQWPREHGASLAMRATPGLGRAYSLGHRLWRLPRNLARRMGNESAAAWLRPAKPPAPFDDEAPLAGNARDAVSEALNQDFHRTVLPTLLRVFDRASMAHGVEIRMPFLDWRLVTFCFALPPECKLGGGFTKRILRAAMKGVLPEEVRTRKHKIGFASPMPRLFGGASGGWIRELVESRDFAGNDLWNGRAIQKFVRERDAAGPWNYHDAERVWPYINAALWLEMFTKGKAVSLKTLP